MHFCEKCGTAMRMNFEEIVLKCSKCGHVEPILEDTIPVKKVERYKSGIDERILVIRDDMEYPTMDIVCEKCGNDKAHYKHILPRWGDEDDLIIYKCTKCRYTWREGFSH